jgi:hypothetical protein
MVLSVVYSCQHFESWQCKFVLRLERREKKKYLILIVFHPSNRSECDFVHGRWQQRLAERDRIGRVGMMLCIEVIDKSLSRESPLEFRLTVE